MDSDVDNTCGVEDWLQQLAPFEECILLETVTSSLISPTLLCNPTLQLSKKTNCIQEIDALSKIGVKKHAKVISA
jgi:hypothetical protein